MAHPLIITPLSGIPVIRPGDDIAGIILEAINANKISIHHNDVLVIAQKIVSKAEGRFIDLSTIRPGRKARLLAECVKKDPKFVELILRESKEVLRSRPGTIIVEHKLGFVCANAGIDHSNVQALSENPEAWVLLLPKNPDLSARKFARKIKERSGKTVGVVIIDSHGRAWRNGIVGTSIGVAGVPPLVDMRGKPDLFGFHLRITQIAAVDELAAAASLVMGQAAEGIPAVHVRGFPYALRVSSSKELHRSKKLDLFR